MKAEEEKRVEVLTAITPICEAFGIKDFDYYIIKNYKERLRLNNVIVCCTDNSIDAIIDEIIGYLLVKRYCHNRTLGAFEKQTLNVVKKYWVGGKNRG